MKLNKQIFGATLAIGFAFAQANQASAAELLSNGGFETGDFTGWANTGNLGFTGITTDAHTGSFAASFGPVGSLGTISQVIATTPGDIYNIDFWLQNDSGGTVNEFVAQFGTTTLADIVNDSAYSYKAYHYTAVATGAATTVAFSFRQDPSFFQFDDASVTFASAGGVPDQGVGIATTALTLVALFGLATYRRQQTA